MSVIITDFPPLLKVESGYLPFSAVRKHFVTLTSAHVQLWCTVHLRRLGTIHNVGQISGKVAGTKLLNCVDFG